MSDWTPTADDVRDAYGAGVIDGFDNAPHDHRWPPGKKYGEPGYMTDTDDEFNRWLKAERARAWDEGRAASGDGIGSKNPYR